MTSTKARIKLEVLAQDATKNYFSSATYMKKLTTICLSTLTYIRGIFPESDFLSEDMLGHQMKILKNNPKSEGGIFFSKKITSVFEAFDKKYLRKLILSLHGDRNDPDSLIEFYVFNYKYNNNNEASVQVHSGTTQKIMSSQSYGTTAETIIKATRNLVRTCVVMAHSCQLLPQQFDLSIQLYYYDEVTPEDYEPKGFEPLLDDTLIDKYADAVTMGRVMTSYHKIKLNYYAKESSDIDIDDHEQIVQVNEMFEQIDSSNIQQLQKDNMEMQEFRNDSLDVQPTDSTSRNNFQSLDIRCPCNRVSEVEHDIIMCRNCNAWQHSVCFGILPDQAQKIKDHCCDKCADENSNLKCSDEKLLQLKPSKRQLCCMFRRALILCWEHRAMNTLMMRDILDVKVEFANKLMHRLEVTKVFEPLKEGQVNEPFEKRQVDIPNLKTAINNYFLTSIESRDIDSVAEIEKMMFKMGNNMNVDSVENNAIETQNDLDADQGCGDSIMPFRDMLSVEKSSQRRHPSDIIDCNLPLSRKEGNGGKENVLNKNETYGKSNERVLRSNKRCYDDVGYNKRAKKSKVSTTIAL